VKTGRALVAGIAAVVGLLTVVDQVSAAARPEPTIVAETADGLIIFVEDAGAIVDGASRWPATKLEALVRFYDEAVARYTAPSAFGSLDRWAEAFGISKDNPIRVIYVGRGRDAAPARAGRIAGIPVITHFALRTSVSTAGVQLVLHEMAHIWDSAHDWALGEAIADTVQNPDAFPTAKARDEGPKEDFAESVTATLWPGYAVNQEWSDNDRDNAGSTAPAHNRRPILDRCDYVEGLLRQ